jgi:hypothetical protein
MEAAYLGKPKPDTKAIIALADGENDAIAALD